MTGQAVVQTDETTRDAPVVAGRRGFKAELGDLRERMRRLGLGFDEIAGEIARRYRLHPRESYRLDWGWSLGQAAARFNALAAQEGTDPQGRAAMTGAHLCEYEHWPSGGRKPSVYVLVMLAQMYETDVLRLLALADHERLAPPDRLTLIRRPVRRAETLFGQKLAALLDERGLSPLREVARRVPCSPAHLSNIAHGRKGASEQLAGLLDRVLDAGGDLEALAEPAARDDKRASRRGHAPGQPPEGTFRQLVGAEGLTLSLPYVPGRLLIEIAEPAAGAGQAASADYPGRVNGQLALIRDLAHEAQPDDNGVPGA